MNNVRIGFTETTLLFFWYLETHKKINRPPGQANMFNWFFTTSGFYDKEITGSYMSFDEDKVRINKTYDEYFRRLFDFLKNSNNFSLELCFHNIASELVPFKEEFLQVLGWSEFPKKINIYDFIQNKNILIINNLGSLMKQQFESGNMQKINPNFPNNVKSIQYFENGYTFFNNGPDSSILETSDKICNAIKNYEFDAAVISVGAYSFLIGEYILNNLKKNIYIIGGDLPFYFGIKTMRIVLQSSHLINEYFIEVPPEMRPIGYEKIENGCYW